jgi:two-component system LytT family sensor kinase
MKKSLLIAAHVLFWGLILSFFCFFVGPNVARNVKMINPNFYVFIHFGVYGILNISIFYFSLLFIIPKTASRKKYLLFIVSVILTVIVFGLIKYLIALNFKDYYLTVGPKQKEVPREFVDYFFSTIIPSGLMISLSIVYKVIEDWFKNDTIQKELLHQKTQAELQFLKSQINPHFLFNSLNNIYALAYKKSDETPAAILKLSEIMRYMLKESDDYKVLLSDEIQYLKSYIDLNRLRYKDGISIELNVNVDNENYRVMPLMLISFIENIFKHGEVANPEIPVQINLVVQNNKLHFETKNQIKISNKDESSGIGLRNIYRRLDLMYPNKYALEIDQNSKQYHVSLTIEL